jgi:hypothetical protein
MKPESQEIERLRRELARMKAERDILQKPGGLLRAALDVKFEFVAKHRGDLAGVVDLRSARCFAQRLSRLTVRAPSARARNDEEFGA